MKKSKLLFTCILLACLNYTAFAQSGNTYISATDSFNLIFVTNNIQRMHILANGNIQIASLITGHSGIVTFDSTGTIHPLNFNGNANTALMGNGTFASTSSFSPWQTSGGNIYYTGGNIGIGTSSPNYSLQIVGDVVDSGSLFATNIATSNSISVGTFRIVNGAVDSIVSEGGALQLNATTINAKGGLTAQTLTAGSDSLAITIDGAAGTIISPSKTVGFGTDTISTTATVKAGALNISGNNVAMPGIVTDTNTDIMSIDKYGHVVPISGSALTNIIANVVPINPTPGPCFSNNPIWAKQGSIATVTNECTWAGVCEAGISGYPDAPLSVSSNNSIIQFSVANTNVTPISDVFTIDKSGNTYAAGKVGIGTTMPASALDVSSSVPYAGQIANFRNGNSDVFITSNMSNGGGDWNSLSLINDNGIFWTDGLGTGGQNLSSGFAIAPWAGSSGGIRIDATGKVAIGTVVNINTTTNYGLYVGNGILTSLVKIALPSDNINWSDYVFANNYKLKTLTEVAQYIKDNKHLPDVPSAADVQKDGINVADMDATLLKKIEELTLYMIQQQKLSEQQQKEIQDLKTQLETIKKIQK